MCIRDSNAVSNLIHAVPGSETSLETLVEQFWRLDTGQLNAGQAHLSVEDKQVLQLWSKSVSMQHGHYELGIPFKSNPGTSLNDRVLQADLTNKLIGVILSFREGKVAVLGDIEAMFHQVKVTVEHRDALRFLWWPDGDLSRNPEVYRKTVHPFGGVWSPSCASFALRRTAEEFGSEFDPETVQTVLDIFYADDCPVSYTHLTLPTILRV